MKAKLERLLADAERHHQSAAAMHFMPKVSYYGGRIDALKECLKLLDH